MVVTLDVKYDDQAAQLSAFVVKGDTTPLLGRGWLKVLKLNRTNIVAATGSEGYSVNAVLEKHKEIFQEGTSTILGYKSLPAHAYGVSSGRLHDRHAS